jgi:hypothetical protein
MRIVISSAVVVILLLSCSALKQADSYKPLNGRLAVRDSSYDQRLNLVVEKVKNSNNPTVEELLGAIPNSDDEYGEFYSLTYPDRGAAANRAFYQIDSLLFSHAAAHPRVLLKYMSMAKYVDGDYAVSFFENVIKLHNRKAGNVCCAIKMLKERSRRRIKSYSSEFKGKTLCEGE